VTLRDLILKSEQLDQEKAALEKDFFLRLQKIEDQRAELMTWRETAVRLARVSPDALDQVHRASKIIQISGPLFRKSMEGGGTLRVYPERHLVLTDAMIEISKGGGRLLTEYFGVKNYDHFEDQRENHAYGYGPKHGSIVFSVGLRREFQRQLTDQEISDVLFGLAEFSLGNILESIFF
jgi:hypothetical protein